MTLSLPTHSLVSPDMAYLLAPQSPPPHYAPLPDVYDAPAAPRPFPASLSIAHPTPRVLCPPHTPPAELRLDQFARIPAIALDEPEPLQYERLPLDVWNTPGVSPLHTFMALVSRLSLPTPPVSVMATLMFAWSSPATQTAIVYDDRLYSNSWPEFCQLVQSTHPAFISAPGSLVFIAQLRVILERTPGYLRIDLYGRFEALFDVCCAEPLFRVVSRLNPLNPTAYFDPV